MNRSAAFLSAVARTVCRSLWTVGCVSLVGVLSLSCQRHASGPLLQAVPSAETGLTFRNEIHDSEGLNVLEYEYFYNGGGVAAGDVNGDGLADLFFTANMGPNALYLNEGGFRFRDVTSEAGLAGGPGWKTGVTMVDVNADGRLDIYVCKSGRVSEALRRNELYINNGDGTFSERAAEFGLDDPSYSTHATFFDYDRDGDLDMFLVNHAVERYSRFDVDLVKGMRDPLAGDKLYRNDGGRFVEASVETGIHGNPIGFGLSATVGDLNQDGWSDVFVANDYIEDDYLYINNQDGTFSEQLRGRLSHTSYSSMGADIADVNNDGLLDLYTLDMMSQDPVRRKLLQGPNDYERYEAMLNEGYHRQIMRNMLQLNNGNGTFSEIGQLAGVAETDWSWAPLLADFDNDGRKDLFVTNGYLRDYTNLDFLVFVLQDSVRVARALRRPIDAAAIVRMMPQTPIPNVVFRNVNGLQFEKTNWGDFVPGFSNGAAYADLDLDGDLDLVVSNINAEASVYRNVADRDREQRFLRVHLDGGESNRFGIGARVDVTAPDGSRFVQELQPSRGYLSSVEPALHFGVGPRDTVEVVVTWPDGRRERRADVRTNQMITLQHGDADAPRDTSAWFDTTDPYFVSIQNRMGLDFIHQENDFVDLRREPLLPHMHSRLGPPIASADVNGDGMADVFVGGAAGQASMLYLQQSGGSFSRIEPAAFDLDAAFEDAAALFLDVDGDGDQDLYVVSGGSWETEEGSAYQDRLYINEGFGRFASSNWLPPVRSSGGAIAAYDFDGDGDLDLFVGGRVSPGRYPEAPRSYLLQNAGGRFEDVTPEALKHPGMVSSAVWADLHPGYDGAELLLTGEWMPLRLFSLASGEWRELTDEAGFEETAGWWNIVQPVDLDGDGDVDIVAGNRGLNHTLSANSDRPVTLYYGDFGHDATIDPILTYKVDGKRYPVAWRDELLDQIPRLRRSFPDYQSFSVATIEEILTREQLQSAGCLDAVEFASSVFLNAGDGTFSRFDLPLEAQFAPVTGIVTLDANQDGRPDLLLAGNNYAARAQWGPYSAGRGVLLLNRGRHDGLEFQALSPVESGFFAHGDVRGMIALETSLGTLVALTQNDDGIVTFGVNYHTASPPFAADRTRPDN